MTPLERLAEIERILSESRIKVSELAAGIEDIIAAKNKMAQLGLTEDSTAEDISLAFANSVDLEAPMKETITTLLNKEMSKEIRDGISKLRTSAESWGTLAGNILGTIAAIGLR